MNTRNLLPTRLRNTGGLIGEATLIILVVQILGVAFALCDRDLPRAGHDALVWLAFASVWSLAFLRRVPAAPSAVRRDAVEAVKQAIVGNLAQGHLPPVGEALAALRDATTEQGAVDVIWNTLATAAAKGDVRWCREFVTKAPADVPRGVSFAMYTVLRPVSERVPDLRTALAERCGKA